MRCGTGRRLDDADRTRELPLGGASPATRGAKLRAEHRELLECAPTGLRKEIRAPDACHIAPIVAASTSRRVTGGSTQAYRSVMSLAGIGAIDARQGRRCRNAPAWAIDGGDSGGRSE
jgi:hypothetical protein